VVGLCFWVLPGWAVRRRGLDEPLRRPRLGAWPQPLWVGGAHSQPARGGHVVVTGSVAYSARGQDTVELRPTRSRPAARIRCGHSLTRRTHSQRATGAVSTARSARHEHTASARPARALQRSGGARPRGCVRTASSRPARRQHMVSAPSAHGQRILTRLLPDPVEGHLRACVRPEHKVLSRLGPLELVLQGQKKTETKKETVRNKKRRREGVGARAGVGVGAGSGPCRCWCECPVCRHAWMRRTGDEYPRGN